ncbi:MAG: SAP domain-containing protein [Candidatus Thalassarchaeum sp.]|nr:SAP domain-containing protein [Candidatus Thalassarchaeum sp.]
MSEDELSAMTVAELKVQLKGLGLSTSGKKSELIARIIESTEDVMILDDDEDDGDEPFESIIDDGDEILEAEVFEAEILDEDLIEEVQESSTSSTIRLDSVASEKGPVWYKDGTTIATILVVILLSGVGGWWYLSNEASVFQTAPSRYGDNLRFNVNNGVIQVDGDEMVALLRDAISPSALDDVCEKLRVEFSGSGSASIRDGSLADLVDPSDTNLEGAVKALDAYGRTWNAVESTLEYDLAADLSGNTWSAINQDSCSSLEWLNRNNQLNIDIKQWHEITERGLMRSETALNFIDAEGQSYSADATTFDGIVGSDSASDLIEGILLPMHPVNLYDIFGLTVMEEGLTGEHEGWGWQIGSPDTIGGEDAIQIRMHHIKIGDCLGRAEMVIWAIPDQPLPAKQMVDISIDKSQKRSGCSLLESEAIDLTFPEGTFVTQYTLEQIDFKHGDDLLDWQQFYATRPMSSDGKPSTSSMVSWVTHLPDNSTVRPFTLEKAVSCVISDSDAFGAAQIALNGDGYVFAAKDDRSGLDPIWNLSWVSSVEAGWVRVTWPGGENCLNSGDGPLTGDEKPDHARNQIPQTYTLALLENRMLSSDRYPDLHPQIINNGQLQDDVQIGYSLVVPEENAVSDWLDDLGFLPDGQVTVYLERTWTEGNIEHSLRVGMDGESARMGGWVLTSTPV